MTNIEYFIIDTDGEKFCFGHVFGGVPEMETRVVFGNPYEECKSYIVVDKTTFYYTTEAGDKFETVEIELEREETDE